MPINLQLPKKNGLFITGTDTSVGKTLIAGAIAKILTDKGLKIFTTLDPKVQWAAENALSSQIKNMNKKLAKHLQGAVLVSHRDSAEVLAIVGGKNSREGDFNRAVNARRPIGSLIKPAIYLTAFEQGYTLSSLLNDKSFSAKSVKCKLWRPKNFDKNRRFLGKYRNIWNTNAHL